MPKSPGHDRLRLSQVREFLRVAPPSVACQVQRTRASSPQLTAKHTIPSIYQELQAFATATMVLKTEKVRLFARREQTRQKKRLRRLAIEGMFSRCLQKKKELVDSICCFQIKSQEISNWKCLKKLQRKETIEVLFVCVHISKKQRSRLQ